MIFLKILKVKISEKTYDKELRMWVLRCPLCDNIAASASEEEMLPEFTTCEFCEREPVYEVIPEDGKLLIRRNKFPRFIGEITFGSVSDIENVSMIDTCVDVKLLGNAMRKAGEYLIKRNRT